MPLEILLIVLFARWAFLGDEAAWMERCRIIAIVPIANRPGKRREKDHSARSARARRLSARDGHPARRPRARINAAARSRNDGDVRREPHGAARGAAHADLEG